MVYEGIDWNWKFRDVNYKYDRTIVKLWNKLPESVVESYYVNVFKKRLDGWSTDVDLYMFTHYEDMKGDEKFRNRCGLMG